MLGQLSGVALLAFTDSPPGQHPHPTREAECCEAGAAHPGLRLLEDPTRNPTEVSENAPVSTGMWHSRATVSPAQEQRREATPATAELLPRAISHAPCLGVERAQQMPKGYPSLQTPGDRCRGAALPQTSAFFSSRSDFSAAGERLRAARAHGCDDQTARDKHKLVPFEHST